MSRQKNRIALSAVSTAKVKSIRRAKSNVAAPKLTGIDEIPQSDDVNTPFILVDSMCTTSRQELHLALEKCEKRRMESIQKQCCVLPLLKYMKPATRDEPTTEEEKIVKEAEEFQEDLKQLCIAELTVGDAWERTGAVTPIAHATSEEDLLQRKPRLERIRTQLEELRQKQDEADLSLLKCSEKETPPMTTKEADLELCSEKDFPPVTTEQPKLLRQGTFDVKRDERLATSLSKSSLAGPKEKSVGLSLANSPSSSLHPFMRSATLSQSRANNVRTLNTPTSLFRNKSNLFLRDSKTSSRVQYSSAPKSHDYPKTVNKISDLMFQLPHQQQEKPNLDKGSFTNLSPSHTMKSDVESIPTSTRHSQMPQPHVLASSSPRPLICNGFDPITSNGHTTSLSVNDSSILTGSNQTQTPPPPIQEKSRSFLKMSSKLFKKVRN